MLVQAVEAGERARGGAKSNDEDDDSSLVLIGLQLVAEGCALERKEREDLIEVVADVLVQPLVERLSGGRRMERDLADMISELVQVCT